jgi:hypothetical protein
LWFLSQNRLIRSYLKTAIALESPESVPRAWQQIGATNPGDQIY